LITESRAAVVSAGVKTVCR